MSPTLQISISNKRDWIFKGHIVSATTHFELSPVRKPSLDALALLSDFLSREKALQTSILEPEGNFEGKEKIRFLSNLRGRPLNLLAVPERRDTHDPDAKELQELLYVEGKTSSRDDPAKDESEREKNTEGEGRKDYFRLRLMTRFLRFREKGEIHYELLEAPNSDSDLSTQLALLGKLLNKKTSQGECDVRLGLEFFRPSRIYILGRMPRMHGRIYMEISPLSIAIFLSEYRRTRSSFVPFSEQGYTRSLSRTLEIMGICNGFYELLEQEITKNSNAHHH